MSAEPSPAPSPAVLPLPGLGLGLGALPDGLDVFVGAGPVNVAVVLDHGALLLVLRPLSDPDQLLTIPVAADDAVTLTRALAGSLRYAHQAHQAQHGNHGQTPGCPACSPRWDRP